MNLMQLVKKKSFWLSLAVIIGLSAGPTFADSVTVDKADLSKGIIKINASVPGNQKVKLMIQKEDKKYVYDLKNETVGDAFPLQLGNGDYKVTVLKNITDNKYTPIASEVVTLNVSDSKLVFLQSIQNISWNMSTKAVQKAEELIKGFQEGTVKIEKVYDFIITNYKYDFDKAKSVQTGYIPVVDDTYSTKKGICYDYSSMFASMLRSFGVPTKLVKGYTSNVEGYHAWNEVYDPKTDKWIVVDTTFDAQMKQNKLKYNYKKEDEKYQNVNNY